MKRNATTTLMGLAVIVTMMASGTAQAGLFLIDLGDDSGPAASWDVFTAGGPAALITDWSGGGDNDVTLTITNFTGQNNVGAPGTGATVDTIAVPKEARDDYLFGGTSPANILFEFKNLDAGTYNVSVFEGRTTDTNGQFGTIWVGTVGDDPGSENTGNISGGSSTLVGLTIGATDSLFYLHQEDNTGGTSGIIVRSTAPAPSIPTPAALPAGLALLGLVALRRRR